MKTILVLIVAALLPLFASCTPPSGSGAWIEEPPFTPEGLIDFDNYVTSQVVHLELDAERQNEILADIEALRAAQRDLLAHLEQLKSDGLVPALDENEVVSLSVNSSGGVNYICFDGGYTFF